MMAERKMEGARLNYRPVGEAELTGEERARAFGEWLSPEERETRIRRAYLERMATETAIDSPWYGLRVAFGREKAVEKALTDLGIECMVPMRKGRERRVRHRVIPGRPEPAITGYVLVRFVPTAEACVGILAVEHAVGLVGSDGVPFPISHREAMEFKAKADDGALDWVRESRVTFRAGTKVRFNGGPFSGLSGVVVSARADRRGDAVVEVDAFGRRAAVTVPLAILEKV